MNRKKPKSGKGERRKAIKSVLAWADVGHFGVIDPREIYETRPYLSECKAKPIRVRIVPLNPKRKAK